MNEILKDYVKSGHSDQTAIQLRQIDSDEGVIIIDYKLKTIREIKTIVYDNCAFNPIRTFVYLRRKKQSGRVAFVRWPLSAALVTRKRGGHRTWKGVCLQYLVLSRGGDSNKKIFRRLPPVFNTNAERYAKANCGSIGTRRPRWRRCFRSCITGIVRYVIRCIVGQY